jgi:hypothetical protein
LPYLKYGEQYFELWLTVRNSILHIIQILLFIKHN